MKRSTRTLLAGITLLLLMVGLQTAFAGTVTLNGALAGTDPQYSRPNEACTSVGS